MNRGIRVETKERNDARVFKFRTSVGATKIITSLKTSPDARAVAAVIVDDNCKISSFNSVS